MSKVKTAGGVIFAVLMLLIFFSRTIYNYNIPEVTAVLPKNGRLNKTETSSGVADWADTYDIYFEMGGKLVSLLIEEGDYVTEGQLLANLLFDTEDVELNLRQLEIDRERTRVAIEANELKIGKLEDQIRNLSAEEYEVDSVSDNNLILLEAKMEKLRGSYVKAEEAYARINILYEAGGISKQELENSKAELDDIAHEMDLLSLEYENAKETNAEAREKNRKAAEEKEKSRESQLEDWNYEIEALGKDIEAKLLELEKNAEEQNSCRRLLKNYGDNISVYSQKSGTVFMVDVKEGQAVNRNQIFASIGLGDTFDILCDISLRNNFVVAGDECRISNNDHAFVAVVSKISPTDRVKEVTVSISSQEITPGETFELEFGKESATTAVLVPNGAVNKDSDNYFLYYIKKRKGILGDEYYAEKIPVYIGDSDNENTIITRGISFFEPIVLLADKPFDEGETIKVRNEGDFFVD